MSDNNFYFETLKQTQGELTEDFIVKRMGDCSMVLNELTNSKVWDILLRDNGAMVKALDDSWQDIQEGSAQFREARVLKMAAKNIIDLPIRYAQELDKLTEELHRRQNKSEVVEKDADNEI